MLSAISGRRHDIPTKASAIFTGGKSAIDLVGIGHDSSVWLFELKTEKNIQVGSLSELFFYSMVVRDVLLRRFGFDNRKPDSRATIFPEHVQAAKQIHARLLASRFHPLISEAALEVLNQRATAQNWEIDYGVVDLTTFLPMTGVTAETVPVWRPPKDSL
jgi:hypothetical protein